NPPNPAQQLEQLIEDFERSEVATNPIRAGREGDRAALGRWPDASIEAAEKQRLTDQAFHQRLNEIDPAALGPNAQINFIVLDYVLGSRVELGAFERQRMPFTNDSGFFSMPFQVARSTRITNPDQAEAWLERIEALPQWLRQHQTWMERGLATAAVQPEYVVEAVVRQLEVIVNTEPEDSPLMMPLKRLPDALDAQIGAPMRARALALIKTHSDPAYEQLLAFFTEVYLAEPRTSIGISSIPGGRELYRALVRYHTTLDTTPEAIHQRGLSEVARIRAEMDEVIAETDFDGSFAEFIHYLRTDPKFYAQTQQELLRHASWIAKRADDAMPSLFRNLPRLPYGIRPVPAELAPTYTTGRYWPGDLDGGIAGAYMVNTYALDNRPLYVLPALTLHEGVPGHHHQFALAAEMENVPRFRRDLYLTAFGEGWGLYYERLGLDMGIYTTPYEHFGRLTYEMWRACRLVVDTGIHYFDWTRQQAEACLLENSALAPHNVTTEVARYISWPGQALAYKPGELLIRDLRNQAEQALGAGFDIRDFHDYLLSDGAIPLNALERKMTQWIDDQMPKQEPIERTQSVAQLDGSRWRIVELQQQAVGDAELTMQFSDDSRVVGRSACNRFNGSWSINADGAVEFGQMMSSKMACSPELMALEQRFNQLVLTPMMLSTDALGRLVAMVEGETVFIADRAPSTE
ncbi:MAG: DUF885 family protein, partial [Pseudomonadota bacterium]